MKIPSRLKLTSKDISNITGYKVRYAQIILKNLRKKLNKPPGGIITLKEFCEARGMNIDEAKEEIL